MVLHCENVFVIISAIFEKCQQPNIGSMFGQYFNILLLRYGIFYLRYS